MKGGKIRECKVNVFSPPPPSVRDERHRWTSFYRARIDEKKTLTFKILVPMSSVNKIKEKWIFQSNDTCYDVIKKKKKTVTMINTQRRSKISGFLRFYHYKDEKCT